MKRLLLVGLLLVVGLTAACGDNDSNDQNASPTIQPGSPPSTAELSAEQIITLTQEYPVLYQAGTPGVTYELKPSTINNRVDVLCADAPRWSARDSGTEWRVVAECRKDESGSGSATPPPYGFESLIFEWIFYLANREVMPVSQAAHDAQYSSYPQPTTMPPITIPAGTPRATPTP